MMCIRILLLLVSLLLPTATSFGFLLRACGPHNSPRKTLVSLRGGAETAPDTSFIEASSCTGKDKNNDDEAFPVVSRFVGGTWKNTYGIFHGIGFDRGEDRVRYTEWTLNHETGECKISLRPEEAPEGSPPIVLKGKHVGNGVIRFGGFGDYEYLFRQVGCDTILVSRTGVPSNSGEATRLDFGSMVLTDENSCVQTIAHTENGDLSMLEVIRGTREP